MCCVWLQICSTAERKAIDKMIDSGPQLAGSMEYNVVLSKCSLLHPTPLLAKTALVYICICLAVLLNLRFIEEQFPVNSCLSGLTFTGAAAVLGLYEIETDIRPQAAITNISSFGEGKVAFFYFQMKHCFFCRGILQLCLKDAVGSGWIHCTGRSTFHFEVVAPLWNEIKLGTLQTDHFFFC